MYTHLNWVDAVGGTLPPGAIAGGQDHDCSLYIGQAYHNNDLLPGKVQPKHRRCYVAWGGKEHGKTDFKVLCRTDTSWVPACGRAIPAGAFPGGITGNGETLFIGRVSHNGTVTIGKVYPSHGKCYIPYGGSEHGFQNFEVLVSRPGTSDLNWVDAFGGTLPPGAIIGGQDHDCSLYIGQAYHSHDLLPGKVQPNHKKCYVAWGGKEHGKTDFKVLCRTDTSWVPTCGRAIPAGALPAGITGNGETLYIGRVSYNGTVTIGKVQPSHGKCYIAYGGSEHGFQNYEILVCRLF